ALVKAGPGHALPGAAHPGVGWLNPWTGSFGSLSNSFLLAVFIYWGWDCALSVNEETKDSARTPGRAAVTATVILVAIFAVISVAALAYAGPAFLAAHSTDVLGAMASSVLGSTPGKLLVLCVLTSTAASAQTTIMPTARAALAMSAHRALPRWFARMHPRYRTPTVATLVMGVVSALFYVLLTAVSKNVLADSAASVGLLIAFYYGLTGFACVWFFRRDLLTSGRALLTKGILPLAGGLTLLAAFVLSIISYWPAASSYSSFDGVGGIFLIGAGSLLAGVFLMLAARRGLPRSSPAARCRRWQISVTPRPPPHRAPPRRPGRARGRLRRLGPSGQRGPARERRRGGGVRAAGRAGPDRPAGSAGEIGPAGSTGEIGPGGRAGEIGPGGRAGRR